MDSFSSQDLVGRTKTIKLLSKYDLVESKDQYAVWDLSGKTTNIAGDEKPFLIEVKDRNVSSTDYDTVFLEFKKYQSLLKVADANCIEDIFYISHFSDSVTYIFNLRKLKVCDLVLTVIKANKTTIDNNSKVDKIFVELQFQQGRKYKVKK